MAEGVKSGIESAGGSARIFQYAHMLSSSLWPAPNPYFRIAETLSDEILAKMHAPPKPNYPIIAPKDLPEYDAYVFGVPTRYGNFPAQWKVGIRFPPAFVLSFFHVLIVLLF